MKRKIKYVVRNKNEIQDKDTNTKDVKYSLGTVKVL